MLETPFFPQGQLCVRALPVSSSSLPSLPQLSMESGAHSRHAAGWTGGSFLHHTGIKPVPDLWDTGALPTPHCIETTL